MNDVSKERPFVRRREPDLIAFPGQPKSIGVRRRDECLPGATVGHGDTSLQVTCDGQFEEGHTVAVGRHAGETESTACRRRFGDDVPHRELELLLIPRATDDRQVAAVWRPVGKPGGFEQLARRASCQRHAREGPVRHDAPEMRSKREGQFPGDRHSQQSGWRQVQRRRLRALRPDAVDSADVAIPQGAVQNRLIVRGKAGRTNHSPPVCQPLVGRRRPGARASPGDRAGSNTDSEQAQSRTAGQHLSTGHTGRGHAGRAAR